MTVVLLYATWAGHNLPTSECLRHGADHDAINKYRFPNPTTVMISNMPINSISFPMKTPRL